jgi:SAM-dependent methyltransferase
MSFKDHFSTQADAYSRFRPRYPASLFAWLADQAPARERAWDSATGNGQAALDLARHFRAVIATDASAQQIAHAPDAAGVDYAVCRSESSPLATASVDVVFVAQALHWFDLDAFHEEVRRVCRAGALLAVCCYGLCRIAPALDEVVDYFYADTLGPYWPPERRLVETGYRDLPFPFETLPQPEFSMTRDWHLGDLVGYLGSWSAVARYRAREGRDPLPDVAAALADVWGDPAAAREIRWPLHLRVGRVGTAQDERGGS